MKWKICILFFVGMGSIFGQEAKSLESPQEVKQEFGYFGLGLGPFPLPLPAFSGGYRAQSGHHGADISLQVQTIVAVTQLKTSLLYHHYFKPCLSSQFYVGGGVGPSVIFGHRGSFLKNGAFLLSPEFVFGKQYRNESNDLRFFQMQLSFPTINFRSHNVDVCEFPLVIISYGIGF